MQLIPRYLVNNVVTIVTNDSGFITEYKPMYSRQLKVYRGIDNVIQFRLLNADQKPVNVAPFTPKFIAFDENGKQIIAHDGSVNQLDDSSASRGKFTITITENDLLNIKQQFLRYNIYLVDSVNNKTLTYVDSHFDNNATIKVDSYAFPGAQDSYSVSTFTEDTGEFGVEDSVWYSESITADPAINGNEALHTIAAYTSAYDGTLTIQATLENQISNQTNWADISTLTFSGTETEPIHANFNGVFNYLRFKASKNPADKVSKILVRN